MFLLHGKGTSSSLVSSIVRVGYGVELGDKRLVDGYLDINSKDVTRYEKLHGCFLARRCADFLK